MAAGNKSKPKTPVIKLARAFPLVVSGSGGNLICGKANVEADAG
jgi:hypothetical protein